MERYAVEDTEGRAEVEAMEYEPLHPPEWDVTFPTLSMRKYLEDYRDGFRIEWDGGSNRREFDTWKGKENMAPLEFVEHLGGEKNKAVIVERVKCRLCPKNTAIARKLVTCRNDEKRKHALAEIRVLINLRHPHIIALIDAYSLDQEKIGILLYPAAEFNLKVFMETFEPSKEQDETRTVSYAKRYHLRRYFACLSQALKFLHTVAKIRHKDITPSNILVDSFGNVLLSDFGLSRKFRNRTESITNTEISTTAEYTTPEFAEKRDRGPKTDVFGLGMVFAEMATVIMGRTPDEFQAYRLKSRESKPNVSAYYKNMQTVHRWLFKELTSSGEPGQEEMKNIAIPVIARMMSLRERNRPESKDLPEDFEKISPIRCPHCHPQSANPWKPDDSPILEEDRKRFGLWEDISKESLLSVPEESEDGRERKGFLPLTDAPGSPTPSNGQPPPDRQSSGNSGELTGPQRSSRRAETTPKANNVMLKGNYNTKVIAYDIATDKIQYVRYKKIKRKNMLSKG